MELIERIFTLIEQSGKGIYVIEKEIGLTRGSLSNWKLGRTKQPSADALSKIADYFNVSVDYLLGRTGIRETVTAENQFKIKKAPSLTDEEKQLLDDYRALSDDTKVLLRGLIINLKKSDEEQQKTTKKYNGNF